MQLKKLKKLKQLKKEEGYAITVSSICCLCSVW